MQQLGSSFWRVLGGIRRFNPMPLVGNFVVLRAGGLKLLCARVSLNLSLIKRHVVNET